jgi:hypothetical protein
MPYVTGMSHCFENNVNTREHVWSSLDSVKKSTVIEDQYFYNTEKLKFYVPRIKEFDEEFNQF